MSIHKINSAPHGHWAEFYTVDSFSDPAKQYVVAKSAQGAWGCSCPRWIYHRTETGDCKHIKAVQRELKIFTQRSAVVPVAVNITPTVQKAISRFSLVEID